METPLLKKERQTMEHFLPGLDAKLAELPLMLMESPESPALKLFREHGGPGLVVPRDYGGLGANPLEVAQIHRALGSRSPSLAIATNMHTCTVVAIPPCESTAELLQNIAKHNLYLASGFADGRAGTSVLMPNMTAEQTSAGWLLSGSKKPCSLSLSMDFMTASVLLPAPSGNSHKELALATIPADAPGIKVRPCVDRWILGGSETNEVILERVEVPNEYISYFGDAEELNAAISKAFLIFELFVSACYLGVATALVERVFAGKRGTPVERLSLVTDVEGAMTTLEGIAYTIMQGQDDEDAVAKSLYVRYFVQQAVEKVSAHATELLGGMAFMGSGETACLYASSRALAFHPPGRVSIATSLDNYLAGQPLIMP